MAQKTAETNRMGILRCRRLSRYCFDVRHWDAAARLAVTCGDGWRRELAIKEIVVGVVGGAADRAVQTIEARLHVFELIAKRVECVTVPDLIETLRGEIANGRTRPGHARIDVAVRMDGDRVPRSAADQFFAGVCEEINRRVAVAQEGRVDHSRSLAERRLLYARDPHLLPESGIAAFLDRGLAHPRNSSDGHLFGFEEFDEPEEGVEVIDVELGEDVIDAQPRKSGIPLAPSRSQQREVRDDAFEVRAGTHPFEN